MFKLLILIVKLLNIHFDIGVINLEELVPVRLKCSVLKIKTHKNEVILCTL